MSLIFMGMYNKTKLNNTQYPFMECSKPNFSILFACSSTYITILLYSFFLVNTLQENNTNDDLLTINHTIFIDYTRVLLYIAIVQAEQFLRFLFFHFFFFIIISCWSLRILICFFCRELQTILRFDALLFQVWPFKVAKDQQL